jgi:hypothetical protein
VEVAGGFDEEAVGKTAVRCCCSWMPKVSSLLCSMRWKLHVISSCAKFHDRVL